MLTGMGVEVRTPQFEGPLDLLLHLILRNEIDLYEISLAAVVGAYLDEIAHMETFDLDGATEFLLIAATLVDLKSRRLLPDLDDGGDPAEIELLEERDRLLARLLECKTFKNAAATFEHLAAGAARSLPRTVGPESHFLDLLPDLLAGVGPEDLAAACARALRAATTPAVDLSHLPESTLEVGDVVDDLSVRLLERGRMTFRELTRSLHSRREVVVHFLALLELFKQGRVELHQPSRFGGIVVEWSPQEAAGAGADAVPQPTR